MGVQTEIYRGILQGLLRGILRDQTRAHMSHSLNSLKGVI